MPAERSRNFCPRKVIPSEGLPLGVLNTRTSCRPDQPDAILISFNGFYPRPAAHKKSYPSDTNQLHQDLIDCHWGIEGLTARSIRQYGGVPSFYQRRPSGRHPLHTEYPQNGVNHRRRTGKIAAKWRARAASCNDASGSLPVVAGLLHEHGHRVVRRNLLAHVIQQVHTTTGSPLTSRHAPSVHS